MRPSPDQVTVQRLIPAPPEKIFDLLADPARHAEIDGSGTVQGPRSTRGGRRLGLGDSFGMSMKWGVPYSTKNVVTELEENRRIAWQTHGPTALGKYVGGRIWRYELEPTDGGTLVRETWDITQESPLSILSTRRMAGMAERNMEKTLARIEELVTD